MLAVVVLGVASLLSNITTIAQLSGEDQTLFAVRRTVSLLLNAGTAWAGVSVLAGWLVRGRLQAAIAGLLAGSGALVVHYGVGELTGLMPPESFSSNVFWFVAAAVTGAPLGLIGAAVPKSPNSSVGHTLRAPHAPRRSRWGLLASLVVPTGAVLEPWVAGWWFGTGMGGHAQRWSDLAAATLLTAAGLAGMWWVARRSDRRGGLEVLPDRGQAISSS
ncbi:hypothetical protein N802_07080 [Knoellia sinensis KCTC 19936]|uniref:Uncharacterized protein n=2 Tax=Knoellia TaxID=136099 RepID=A0A0A0IYY0_9MICO|nr:hypothetical protein N802_07080 [Knoellia sinensis KCTC 19936]